MRTRTQADAEMGEIRGYPPNFTFLDTSFSGEKEVSSNAFRSAWRKAPQFDRPATHKK